MVTIVSTMVTLSRSVKPRTVGTHLTDSLRGTPFDRFEKEARALAVEIYCSAWERDVGPRPGFRPIMLAGGFARMAWYVDPGPPPLIKIQSCSNLARFAMTPNSLQDHRAGWLRRMFHDGMGRLCFSGE
jgi:hypothetical protein